MVNLVGKGGEIVSKAEIEKIVDSAFAKALSEIKPAIDRELYPAAFANEYSWLRVKCAFDLNNEAIRSAVKESLCAILSDLS